MNRPVGGGPRAAIPRATEAIRAAKVEIRVRHPLTPAQLELLDSLNVTVIVDPAAKRCYGRCPICEREEVVFS